MLKSVAFAFSVVLGITLRAVVADEPAISFNRQIRPILSNTCYACHGPDANKRQAELRFDIENDTAKKAIAEELIDRLTSDDPDLRMPPPDSGKSLTKAQIELLNRWVKQGGRFEKHWAFIPPKREPVPNVNKMSRVRTAIDRFLLARLEKEKLSFSEPASKAVLVRRVTLDLTGLPPSQAEIDAFVKDDSPLAYERLVDRLLASPRFGEHFARFWLDAARYGDTHGLHLDNYREMWAYRDWVVRAYNANKPFDEFVIEQLAGDLLPNATLEQKIATGFNRCHVTTSEGGSIAEEVYVRNVVDRVGTTGTVFLGLTIGCARCHDHKFDPVPMRDFYSMFAYFNSIDGKPLDGNKRDHAPVIRAPSPAQQRIVADLEKRIAAAEKKLLAIQSEDLADEQSEWEQSLGNRDMTFSDWWVVGPFAEEDRFLFRRNHGPEGKPFNVKQTFRSRAGEELKWTARVHWRDGEVQRDLPNRISAMFLYRRIDATKPQKLSITLGAARGMRVYLNRKPIATKMESTLARDKRVTLNLSLKKGANHLLIKLVNFEGEPGFVFRARGGSRPPADIITTAAKSAEQRTDRERARLAKFFRYQVSAESPVVALCNQLKQLREDLAAVRRQIGISLIWKETPQPKPAYLLLRGEYDKRGKAVPRKTPGALPALAKDYPNDRLGMARWLTDGRHPLTARVAVNRLWQHLFGVGIVKTSEDFGSQGEPPVHPELLDWLAMEFTENGWDVKRLVRLMVTSAAYRQTSRATKELLTRDRENRLLTRGPRYRLDAEMLRDQALFHSGLLVEYPGGRSVRPPQPEGLWYAVGYTASNTARFRADEGRDKVHRRTLYTFIKRTSPPPQMSTFDAPSREECVVRRERTNTPLQALLLMNDPQYVEAARVLAQRTLREGGTDDKSRAKFLFRLVTARDPEAWETNELLEGLADHRAEYRADPAAAKKLIHVGSTRPDANLNPVELAGWTMTATLALNLDEVLNKN